MTILAWRYMSAASILATLASAHHAYAQPGTAPSEAGAEKYDEIVVTARKRSESIQDVPASVLVIGATQIENLNAKTLQDLNGAAPNMRIANDGRLTIRGISSDARNAGFEAGAAVYIDGVYQGRPLGNNQDLTDIAQIEVLRGPQGTLYGKNTTAGAISITTVRPGNEWSGRAELQYGRFDELRVAGYVAGPLATDLAAIKLSAFRRKSDGYQVNLFDGSKIGDQDSWGGRAELRLTPGPLDIALRGDYIYDDGTPPVREPVAGFAAASSPGKDSFNFSSGMDRNRKGGGASLSVDADLGGGYSLTSISAYRKLRTQLTQDFDWSPLDIGFNFNDDLSTHYTQEVRLASAAGGRFSWMIGGFYFHQKLVSDRSITFLPNPLVPFNGVLVNDVVSKTDAFAAFANIDAKILDRLTLNVGLRYTHERKTLDFDQINGVTGLPTYPNLMVDDRFSDEDLSPTASLSYKFSPDVTGYLKYSRGYKSGGWNPGITTTSDIGFGPENVTNYEAGLRTQFAGNRIGVNLTGYYMNYDDLQVAQWRGTLVGYAITNAGKARVKGLEAEVNLRPSDWFSLTASGAYNDATFLDFDTGTGDNFAGQQFTFAPKWTGFLSADGKVPLSGSATLKAHADVRYQSRTYFDDERTVVPGLGAFAQGGYALLNARLGVEFANGLEITGFVDNLTNNRALAYRFRDTIGLGLTLDEYIPPRQYGVRASFSF